MVRVLQFMRGVCESGRSKSASSPNIVFFFSKIRRKKNISQQIADLVGISKVSAFPFLRDSLIIKKENTRWAPQLLKEERKLARMLERRANCF